MNHSKIKALSREELAKNFKRYSIEQLIEYFKDHTINPNSIGIIPYPIKPSMIVLPKETEELLSKESYLKGVLIVKLGAKVDWLKTGQIIRLANQAQPKCVISTDDLPLHYFATYANYDVEVILPNTDTWITDEEEPNTPKELLN